VHALDGYPPYLPNDDFAGLLDSPDVLRACVAEVGDEIVGHVALANSCISGHAAANNTSQESRVRSRFGHRGLL
jgi:hypothetical protein